MDCRIGGVPEYLNFIGGVVNGSLPSDGRTTSFRRSENAKSGLKTSQTGDILAENLAIFVTGVFFVDAGS